MIDLDDFKNINDTYGHLAGDEVLLNVTTVLKKVVAKKDIVIRWGGDEFIILVPSMSEDVNMTTIEAFEKAIKNNLSSDLPPIGLSVGFALYPDGGETFQQLIKQADYEMYRRKENKLSSLNYHNQ